MTFPILWENLSQSHATELVRAQVRVLNMLLDEHSAKPRPKN